VGEIMKSCQQKQYAVIILIFATIFFTSSCTGSKSITPIEKPSGQSDMSLEKSYSKVIIQKFEVDQDLEKNYPGITVNCESALMNELLQVSSISQIEKARANSVRQRGALIVKTRVTTLKLAGSNTAPEMTANVRLIDSATGITIREKDLSTLSSGSGSSDQMLPYNLGKIIAQYVAASLSGN
jgi:hypothetical protein